MCGLVGLAGKVDTKERKAFKLLLQFDTDRGPHSTGLCAVNVKGEPEIFKAIGTPWEVYQHKRWDTVFNPVANVLIGHNRWATKGKINRVNAHPFEHGDITGCHNGTLRNQFKLTDAKDFEVDSENIIYNIDHEGVQATIPKLDGAYALTWWNAKHNTLNMIRNSERPLWYGFSEDNKTLFWASEKWMLHVSLGIAGIEHHDIKELPVNELHTFPVPLGFPAAAKAFGDFVTEELEGFVPPPYQYPVYSGPSGSGSSGNKGGTDKSKKDKPHVKLAAGTLDMHKWVGQTVEVSIEESVMGNSPHWRCKLILDPRIEVRIYAMYDRELWTELGKAVGHSFARLHIKRLTRRTMHNKDESYLCADRRSVEVISWADWADENTGSDDDEARQLAKDGEELCDYNGRSLTVAGYHKATKNGCAWCTSHVTTKDAGEIAWLAVDEFVCGACVDLPDVKAHINAV